MTSDVTRFAMGEPDRHEAKKGANFLDRAESTEAGLFSVTSDGERIAFELPPALLAAVRVLLERIADSHEVLLLNPKAELSPEQAAKMLGISRPLVYQRMDNGRLPYREVGTHRRVLLQDVLKLMEFEDNRQKFARELAADTDDLETNYAPSPKGPS